MANTMKMSDGSVALLNQYDLASAATGFDWATARTVLNTRTIGGNDVTASNQHSPTWAANAFALYGTSLWDQASYDLMTNTSTSCGLGIYGGTAGDVAYGCLGKLDSRSATGAVDQVNTANVTLNGESWFRGLALNSKTTISATGAQTGQNIGTIASGATTVVFLAVTAATSLTTTTVRIDSSTDNGSVDTYAQVTGWSAVVGGGATLTSNAVVFTTTGYAILTLTTGTEAWLRANVTVLTGTSYVLTVAAGRLY